MHQIKFELNELSSIKEIIVHSIRTRVEKAGRKGGIVALSGGVDSSLVCKLTHLALGSNTFFLIMPEKELTSEDDIKGAEEFARSLKTRYKIIDISGLVTSFEDSLSDEKGNKDWAIANLKPRIRMLNNYFYANLMNYLVIGTSNKTELLLGYGTKFGDMAADIYPIGDLYKTQVWQLAEFLDIPTEIVKKVPSAGLWAGQTDEEELGQTYAQIDQILFHLVDLELSIREAHKLLSISIKAVQDIYNRIVKNEHKRRQPTITKISKMCLDKDWRYPVERF